MTRPIPTLGEIKVSRRLRPWRASGLKRFLPVIGALFIAACTQQTTVSFAPNATLDDLPEQRIAGSYVLVIDPGIEHLSRKVRGRGLVCSRHTFEIDIAATTRNWVAQTLEQVFEDIRVLSAAKARDEMRSRGVNGIVTVRVDRFAPWLTFQNGTVALTNLDLSLAVEGTNGPLFRASVSTARRGEPGVSATCLGGAEALAESAELAIQEALTRLVNQLMSSEEVRRASTRS